MATDQIRQTVWFSGFDVARLARYYETMADRHSRRQKWLRAVLLGSTASGFVSLINLLPTEFQSVAWCGVATCLVWESVSDYAKKAAVLHAISLECSRLGVEWRELWGTIGQIDDNEAQRYNAQLEHRLNEVTGWAGLVSVAEDKKLLRECETLAKKVLEDEYGRKRNRKKR